MGLYFQVALESGSPPKFPEVRTVGLILSFSWIYLHASGNHSIPHIAVKLVLHVHGQYYNVRFLIRQYCNVTYIWRLPAGQTGQK